MGPERRHGPPTISDSVEHFIENGDIDIISPQALPDQVDAIIRRRAAGHVGTICVTGDVRDRIDHFDGNRRFKAIRNFLRALRDSGT